MQAFFVSYISYNYLTLCFCVRCMQLVLPLRGRLGLQSAQFQSAESRHPDGRDHLHYAQRLSGGMWGVCGSVCGVPALDSIEGWC